MALCCAFIVHLLAMAVNPKPHSRVDTTLVLSGELVAKVEQLERAREANPAHTPPVKSTAKKPVAVVSGPANHSPPAPESIVGRPAKPSTFVTPSRDDIAALVRDMPDSASNNAQGTASRRVFNSESRVFDPKLIEKLEALRAVAYRPQAQHLENFRNIHGEELTRVGNSCFQQINDSSDPLFPEKIYTVACPGQSSPAAIAALRSAVDKLSDKAVRW